MSVVPVAERVVADDFYTRPHRHIFTEMARLQESGSPIDLITLAESLSNAITLAVRCLSRPLSGKWMS